jgi:hypothetical protein
MEKEFIPYQEVLELKQLGFDEPCFGWFASDRTLVKEVTEKTDFTLAPTYSQAFRWFREKYSWQHSIDATSDQHRFELGYNYWIWNNKTGEEHHTMPKNRPTGDWEYETYEQAELACLQHLIKIVKEKQK